MQSLKDINVLLDNYKINSNYKHDYFALLAIKMAMKTGINGNVGIGAVILNTDNNVIIKAGNEIFKSGFRTDLHAEMVAINKLENQLAKRTNLLEYTIITSVEPCPMCLTRLIFSGIGRIFYVCPDDDGGMVSKIDKIPQIFQDFTQSLKQTWAEADCSPVLKMISFQIWNITRSKLDKGYHDGIFGTL